MDHMEKVSLKNYLPLVGIIGLICAATYFKQHVQGFTTHGALNDFMGFFFFVFGCIKLLDVKGFAQAYPSYDLVARRIPTYAYAYPFIEVGIGLSYLFGFAGKAVHLFVAVLMAGNSYSVLRALTEKNHIACACLGTLLQVPLTYVSLMENLLMLAMALWMLIG